MDKLLCDLAANGLSVRSCVSGAELSLFRTGGAVTAVAEPRTLQQLSKSLSKIRQWQRPLILGKGSNTLISDGGYSGIVIRTVKLAGITPIKGGLYCLCGTALSALNGATSAQGLSGLEWSVGIPATVGGLAAMNGGAFGGEAAQAIAYIDGFLDGKQIRLSAKEMQFAYRDSLARHTELIIGGVAFKLTSSNTLSVRDTMRTYMKRRLSTQPVAISLGSTFKRHEGESAAKYLTSLQLGGTKLGGAQLSTVHNGFIVNVGGATTTDYLRLARLLQEELLHRFGKRFTTELCYIGEYNEHFWRLSHSYRL